MRPCHTILTVNHSALLKWVLILEYVLVGVKAGQYIVNVYCKLDFWGYQGTVSLFFLQLFDEVTLFF